MNEQKKPYGYTYDGEGNKSMMRLLAHEGFWVGAAAIAAGIVALFLKVPNAIVPITVGGGLAGGSEFFKFMQKKAENAVKKTP